MLATTWPSWPAVGDRASRFAAEASALHAACRRHPFVKGILDGTLPADLFSRWVEQDWLYLLTYVDVLGRVSSEGTEVSARLGELGRLTREVELDLHRSFARDRGLTPEQLDRAAPYPATRAYTAFLRVAGTLGSSAVVAALLPCAAGYLAIAREPADAGPYAAWLATYRDPAFVDAVAFLEGALNDVTDLPEPTLRALHAAGAAHELAFWDALWQGPGATP